MIRKSFFMTILTVVFFSASVHPASASALNVKPVMPFHLNSPPFQYTELLFPGLEWSMVKAAVSIDFVTDGNSTITKTQGTAYRSNNFKGKPSADLFAFYYLEHMKSLGWLFVRFIDSDFLMEIQYYNPKLDKGLDVKLGRSNLINGSTSLPDQFCAEVWVSSSAIEPTPLTLDIEEVKIPSHPISADSKDLSVVQNPLSVPFYSQRLSDPTGAITLGYGKCAFTFYDLGCTVAAYTMIYDYYQSGFTDPIRLNETLKVAPGIFSLYQSGCYIYWPDYLDLPDAPAGVSGSSRVYNSCGTPNCLDATNLNLIDNELRQGHPIHARVHWEGEDENHHSVVIIGHTGSEFNILDPLALDDSPRTLTTGVEGEYIVDYLIPTHGNPPAEGSSSISTSSGTNEPWHYIKKYFPNCNVFLK